MRPGGREHGRSAAEGRARTRRRRRRRGRSLARGGYPPRRSGPGCVGGPGPSAVKVAAPAAAVRLGLELALKLHQALDLSAVGTDVRLDLGGQLADGGQVDAEQLRAPLQRRRDRPAQVGLVPSPHRGRVLKRTFEEEATDHLGQLPDEVDTALRIPHPAAIAIRSEPGSPSAGGHALCVSGFPPITLTNTQLTRTDRRGIVGGVEWPGLWRYARALHPDADPPFPTAAPSR
jgi:hypothetical protein